MNRRYTALIVDDEALARQRIRTLLAAESDLAVAGEAATAGEAVTAVHRLRPDLLFLDIDMPEGDGFTVLAERLPLHPMAVVFVTAHGEHALRAFDVSAVDYLLKPFTGERLSRAVERARTHLAALASAPRAAGLTRIPVHAAGRIVLVGADEVEYLRAEGNYVRIHTPERSYLLRASLAGLLDRLAPGAFTRIHRSTAVRIDRVREIEVLDHGELALRLAGGARVVSGRSYREAVRAALGLAD